MFPLSVYIWTVTGAIVGSGASLCGWRFPRGGNAWSPNSRCPACDRPIPLWWNVPIISWLALRGRAKCCGARLDPADLAAELWGAALFCAFRIIWPAPLVAPFVGVAVLIAIRRSQVEDERRVLRFPVPGGAIVLVAVSVLDMALSPFVSSDVSIALGVLAVLVVLLRRHHAWVLVLASLAAGAVGGIGGAPGTFVVITLGALILALRLAPERQVRLLGSAGVLAAFCAHWWLVPVGVVLGAGFFWFFVPRREDQPISSVKEVPQGGSREPLPVE